MKFLQGILFSGLSETLEGTQASLGLLFGGGKCEGWGIKCKSGRGWERVGYSISTSGSNSLTGPSDVFIAYT